MAILRRKAEGVSEALAKELARAMEQLRERDLFKPPGVAETLDWGAALSVLGATTLTPDLVDDTLGVVLKYQEDIARIRAEGVDDLLSA